MKYVSRDPTGAFDLTKYEDYLERERLVLAACIHGAELLTIDRFAPTGPGSFHDGRFERLLVAMGPSEHAGSETQTARAELLLRGPYFDRRFELHYQEVESCRFEAPASEDDLLMHEIRGEHGLLTHELLFDKGKAITVTCRRLRFLEILEAEGVANEPDR
jgi:hypothetical protein